MARWAVGVRMARPDAPAVRCALEQGRIVRTPTAQRAIRASCACTAPIQATREAGSPGHGAESRWLRIRNVGTGSAALPHRV